MDSSSIPNACSRCFQASQEILLLHSLLGFEQCLLHWVLASTVLQSSQLLLCKTCRNNRGRWTRPACIVVLFITRSSVCKHPHGRCALLKRGEPNFARAIFLANEVVVVLSE